MLGEGVFRRGRLHADFWLGDDSSDSSMVRGDAEPEFALKDLLGYLCGTREVGQEMKLEPLLVQDGDH